ncbi:MAG: cell division protein FtsA [Fibrobacterales bacterium]
MNSKIIVGLDIGSSKIGVVIGEIDEENNLNLVGIGTSPSGGLNKGCVVNIDKTVVSIEKAVEEAKLMAGTENIKDVYVSLSGDHIRSIEGRGMTAVMRPDNEITAQDVINVIDQAKTISLPSGKEVLHALPQGFVVDDETAGITDPIGMTGVKLEGYVHVITGATTAKQNVLKAVTKAGLNIMGIVVTPLAASYSVLEDDEKELGVAVIDVGGGTTDVSIYLDNAINHTFSIGFGGKNVTSDIAIGIRTPVEKAEEIKKKYGSCGTSNLENDRFVVVPGVGGRPQREIPQSVVSSIIRARMQEIYMIVLKEIKRKGLLDRLGAGIVLTGGCSITKGAMELAEEVFGVPVKLGKPISFGGLTDVVSKPENATGVGLVVYGQHQARGIGGETRVGIGNENLKNVFNRFINFLKNYI